MKRKKCCLKAGTTTGQAKCIGYRHGAIAQAAGALFLSYGFSMLEVPNEAWQSTIPSEHVLCIFQLKLSQLEQSNLRETSSWVAHRAIYCVIAYV